MYSIQSRCWTHLEPILKPSRAICKIYWKKWYGLHLLIRHNKSNVQSIPFFTMYFRGLQTKMAQDRPKKVSKSKNNCSWILNSLGDGPIRTPELSWGHLETFFQSRCWTHLEPILKPSRAISNPYHFLRCILHLSIRHGKSNVQSIPVFTMYVACLYTSLHKSLIGL